MKRRNTAKHSKLYQKVCQYSLALVIIHVFFLIGNDYPHDIIMINIQKNFTSRDLRNFTAFPSLPGLIMKYLNADAQGQFILRPRNSARSQKSESDILFWVAFLSSHFKLS